MENSFSLHNPEAYRILDGLALLTHTDKSSLYHNYTEIYARYFSLFRNEPIKFLEIGIQEGKSVELWEGYFRNAELHFLDISLENVKYHSPRSHYHIGNQENCEDLERMIKKTGGGFHIIIDDGGHIMRQQIASFHYLFPHLASGGIYCIEDMHTSYWKEYGGGDHSQTTMAFLKSLIDAVNYIGNHTGSANHLYLDPTIKKDLTLYREAIESIHFYDSLAFIIKR